MKRTWKITKNLRLNGIRECYFIADWSRATVLRFHVHIKFRLAYLMLITFVIFRVCVYLPYKFISLVYKLNSHTWSVNAIVLDKRCPRDHNLVRISKRIPWDDSKSAFSTSDRFHFQNRFAHTLPVKCSLFFALCYLLSIKRDPRPTNSKWTFWLKIVLMTRKFLLSFVKIPCTQHSNIHYSSQFKAKHRNDSKYYLKFCTLSGPRLKDAKISDTVNIIRNYKNSPGTPFW